MDATTKQTDEWLEKAAQGDTGTICDFLAITQRPDNSYALVMATEDTIVGSCALTSIHLLNGMIAALTECRAMLQINESFMRQAKESSTLA